MDPLVRFEQYIQAHGLCGNGQDRILLAVSGGKDSMLMLHLFAASGYRIGIAHCNFRLRGTASDLDEQLVRDYAVKWNAPVYVRHFDTKEYAEQNGISIQMAARELRYAWFEELCIQEGYDRIAVAHHASDQVETMLINLLRGTGIRGLQGMRPRRGMVIRPLLGFTGDEITAVVAGLDLEYRDDDSNFSSDYLRNKLRLEVVPLLREINPRLEETFAHNAGAAGEIADWLDVQVTALREQYFKADGPAFRVDLGVLRQLKPLGLLVYELFRPFGFTGAVGADMADVLADPEHPVSGLVFYSHTHVFRLDRDFGYLSPLAETGPFTAGPEATAPGYFGEIEVACCTPEDVSFEPPQEEASQHRDRIFVDADRITLPLRTRNWQIGDMFQPLGMGGRHKKLSDLFVSLKIPRWQKDQIPIVCDATGEIIWIVPYHQSEQHKIRSDTKNVMTLTYICKDGR